MKKSLVKEDSGPFSATYEGLRPEALLPLDPKQEEAKILNLLEEAESEVVKKKMEAKKQRPSPQPPKAFQKDLPVDMKVIELLWSSTRRLQKEGKINP